MANAFAVAAAVVVAMHMESFQQLWGRQHGNFCGLGPMVMTAVSAAAPVVDPLDTAMLEHHPFWLK